MCVCGEVRGQFHALRNATQDSISLVGDLWRGIRKAFAFHDIPLIQCKHQFLALIPEILRLEGKDLISAVKNSTANLMSHFLSQETVPGGSSFFFTKKMTNRIQHSLYRKIRLSNGQFKIIVRDRGLALMMSLIQTKREIGLVPEDLIEKTLQKHRNTLTQEPLDLVSTTRQQLHDLGRAFGDGLSANPSIPLPTSKATFEFSRSKGGYKTFFGDLVPEDPSLPSVQVENTDQRVSLFPVCAGLYGPLTCQHIQIPVLVAHKRRFSDDHGFPIETELRCPCHMETAVALLGDEINWNSWTQNPGKIAVKPVAIPEPLKVRVITKANSFVYLLKMIQEPMTKRLNSLPVFVLTGAGQISGSDTDSLVNHVRGLQTAIHRDPRKLFISGDYDAATDNMPLDAIKSVIRGMCETMDTSSLPPLLRKILLDLIESETNPHDILYEVDGEHKFFEQVRGQLMGSLLSFPILCLVNYLTVLRARFGSNINIRLLKFLFHDTDILINGDDLLFVDHPEVYSRWQHEVAECGLTLSVGKNYISRDFGTINSRLLTQDRLLPVMRFGDLNSENSHVLDKWTSFSSQFENVEDFRRGLSFFRYQMCSELKKTNLPLCLPKCLGGPLLDHLWDFVPQLEKDRIDPLFGYHFFWRLGRPYQGEILLPGSVRPKSDVSVDLESYWNFDNEDKSRLPSIRFSNSFRTWLSQLDTQGNFLPISSLFDIAVGFDFYRTSCSVRDFHGKLLAGEGNLPIYRRFGLFLQDRSFRHLRFLHDGVKVPLKEPVTLGPALSRIFNVGQRFVTSTLTGRNHKRILFPREIRHKPCLQIIPETKLSRSLRSKRKLSVSDVTIDPSILDRLGMSHLLSTVVQEARTSGARQEIMASQQPKPMEEIRNNFDDRRLCRNYHIDAGYQW